MTDPKTPQPPKAPQAPETPDALSLAMNHVPVLLLGAGAGLSLLLCQSTAARLTAMLAWLYLAPPLLARVTTALAGTPTGRFTLGTSAYRTWWLLTQLQLPFNRLPWLEELLRLVPGLYPLWIALWGGRLSMLAFVGSGVLITDRHLVHVGRGAVLGMHSALAGHMVLRDANGRFAIVAAAPVVEPHAIVGGAAALGPGAILRSGQLLPSGRRIAPFDEWPRRRMHPPHEGASNGA